MGQQVFETIIGLEVHVQLSTKSKAFCTDSTLFGETPNANIGIVSLGHPGSLPYMNKTQVQYALRLGLALNGYINRENTFDRKNYFYADLPKGYQITQDKKPISSGGYLPIKVGDTWKNIRIHHIHMEEDAGKSIHTMHDTMSYIDLNRAGIPLIEIVTEPDLRSGAEVDAFMTGIRQLVRYLEISDGNMEEGSLRCDVNISIRPQGTDILNNRCEIKNVNSMKFARQAIEFEEKRQLNILLEGGKVAQQTLNFDPSTGVTTPLRSKEDAHDYRYFPEPDLPPIHISDEFLEEEKNNLPVLPWNVYKFLHQDLGLPAQEASILSEFKDTFVYFKIFLDKVEDKKLLTNFMVNKLLPYLNEKGISIKESPFEKEGVLGFLSLIESGKISHSQAYQKLFPLWIENPTLNPLEIAEKHQLLQEKIEGKIESIFNELMIEYPQKWSEFKSGKKGLSGFFMGELMKKSGGKSDPKEAMEILTNLLKNS
ncbi:MAG: Asp-tRNA(Asn)/Glu-tRNA(Gln) amidotransferase subunit GatB [Bacteroidetes bacterium]|nr:Asp-tRNA(Asn)/Glu-tRNA(Gln) amidotransferase subunit GatB [Bacteroidota bacterium]